MLSILLVDYLVRNPLATQAFRICYGTLISITCSLDESHNLLMIRLSRTRRNEFVMTCKTTQPFSQLYNSGMQDSHGTSQDTVLVASVEDMKRFVPTYDARRRMLAIDALASVDGCRVVAQVTFHHLFGMILFV